MGKKVFPRDTAWAVVDGKVGVLHLDVRRDRKTNKVKEVVRQFHPVDENGLCIGMVDNDWSTARIATRREIPAARIAGVDAAVLESLGYL